MAYQITCSAELIQAAKALRRRSDSEARKKMHLPFTELDGKGNLVRKYWIFRGTFHRTDGPAWIGYYTSGKISHKQWWDVGRLHRINGPAIIEYHTNGKKSREEWRVNHQSHRVNGPAIISYFENGKIKEKQWMIWDRKVIAFNKKQPQDFVADICDKIGGIPKDVRIYLRPYISKREIDKILKMTQSVSLLK